MATRFKHLPTKPTRDECQDAHLILESAHDAASSFLDIFNSVRTDRKARGTPTDEEQDLLRAMLIFATAGLDSMVKQLIRDALPSVIDRNIGATEMFKRHIERRIEKEEKLDRRFLSDILGDKNPRKRLIDQLTEELTSKSLQSTDQLSRAAAHFAIKPNEIYDDAVLLTEIFEARNQVAHEMDVDFGQSNRSRRNRARAKMIQYTNEIFRISSNFLAAVDLRLGTNPSAVSKSSAIQ
jgi:hypothetical protein